MSEVKKIKAILIFLTLISYCGCSQNISQKILGGWTYKGINPQDVIECPDFIIFNENGNYSILNDCYGNDIQNPIIEKGTWSYEKGKILLKNRIFYSNYIFHDTCKVLSFYLKNITNKELIVMYKKKSTEIMERFERENKINKIETHTGTGSEILEMKIVGDAHFLKLSYEFFKEPDEIIIYNQNEEELYKSGLKTTTKIENVTVNISGSTKIQFKIICQSSSSNWRVSATIN